MRDAILRGEPDVAVTLRRSARARRMTLRVSRTDGRVTLTLPRGVPEAEALAFAQERAGWIRKHLAAHVPPCAVALGGSVPVLGEMRRIVPGTGRSVVLSAGEIAVPGAPERTAARLHAYLRQLARSELAFASDHYAAALGRPYARLTLRDTRSRWGSCSSAGALMYSWRLIMAPAEVLSYVAAHEVAHLAEMNHGPRFWALVDRLYGDPAGPKAWLRGQGHDLHRYRFGD